MVLVFGQLRHNVGLFIPPTIHNRHSDANIHQCHWGNTLPHTQTGKRYTHKQIQTDAHTHAYTHDSTHTHTPTHTHIQTLTNRGTNAQFRHTQTHTYTHTHTHTHTHKHAARVRESEKIESKKPEQYLYEGESDGRCGSGCSECHNTAA